MKTAKELCEELKNVDVEYVINILVRNKLTEYISERNMNSFYYIEKCKTKLEALGYKITIHEYYRPFFGFGKKQIWAYKISACCGEENEA